jgi:predicted negative regulator of RcsB-dependent stress response
MLGLALMAAVSSVAGTASRVLQVEGSGGPAATANTTFFLDDRFGGFSLTDSAGKPRGCTLLDRQGSRVSILFEAKPGETLRLSLLPDGKIPARGGEHATGLRHEARSYDGREVKTRAEFEKLWADAPLEGARLEERVYLGSNPFGPATNALHRFDGEILIRQAGDTAFCVATTDASFLLIDGKEVAAWPGLHPVQPGQDGSKRGSVNLTAGLHGFTFLHANSSPESYEIAAMVEPGGAKPFIIPSELFPSALYAKVGTLTGADGKPEPEFIWENKRMFTVGPCGICEHTFEATTDGEWRFGDGATLKGKSVSHLFFAAGPARVTFKAGGAERTQTIGVVPLWGKSENDEKQSRDLTDLAIKQEREAAIQPAGYPVIVEALYFFLREEEAATFAEQRMMPRVGDIPANALIPTLTKLALGVQQVNENYALAEKCFKEIIARSPDPHDRAVAQLHYAGLLTLCLNRPEDARALIRSIREQDLAAWEPRLLAIYKADIALALDDYATAQKMYAAIPPEVQMLDGAKLDKEAMFSANSRFFRIRNLIAQGLYRESLPEVDMLEWEFPAERASPQVNLLKVQALIGNAQPKKAIVCLQRALTASVDESYTPKLRLQLAKLYAGQGQLVQAKRQIESIKKDFPWTYEEIEARKLAAEIERK